MVNKLHLQLFFWKRPKFGIFHLGNFNLIDQFKRRINVYVLLSDIHLTHIGDLYTAEFLLESGSYDPWKFWHFPPKAPIRTHMCKEIFTVYLQFWQSRNIIKRRVMSSKNICTFETSKHSTVSRKFSIATTPISDNDLPAPKFSNNKLNLIFVHTSDPSVCWFTPLNCAKLLEY